MHVPVDESVASQLGDPRCAFVTGGPREYLSGMNCISHRLETLGSRFPLLVMVEPEDEAFMRRHVIVNSHPSSAVLPWRRFPDPANRSLSWRYRSAHVMDKMNLFGMPFRRLVWIDADMFVRRNVDVLCELPDDVPFASSLDAEGKPTHCWPKRASCPGNCSRTYNVTGDGQPYVGQRVPEFWPPPSRCPYIIQSGVMMLQPLNLTAYNKLIVEPVSRGLVSTYDSGDQGIISTMMYSTKWRLFGDAYMRLHPRFNVIARHAKHTEQKWSGGPRGQSPITAALLHFTRETRPWQSAPRMDNVTRAAEWCLACGAVVCKSMRVAPRRGRRNASRLSFSGQEGVHVGATHTSPQGIGIHVAWEKYCGLNATGDANSSTAGVA